MTIQALNSNSAILLNFPIMSQNYGFIFDKAGNYKIVSAPIYGNGKKVAKPTKTITGAIPQGVGFPSPRQQKS